MGVDISTIILEPDSVKPSNPIRFQPANVLVVDDIENNRNLLIECFADSELIVSAVENGLEAVNTVKQGNVDLVLMDIRMPVLDGYQAAEQIKGFSKVPIVALTASVMQDDYDRSNSVHFDGYLRKPVLKTDLVAEMKRFLPYESIAESTAPEKKLALSKDELRALPNALNELEKLSKTCEQISKSNNMSEIAKFADAVLRIGNRHHIKAVIDYAEDLHSDIDSFDLVAIKRALAAFPDFITQLWGYTR
jgi:two-component system sensor histidine kinase EvgS